MGGLLDNKDSLEASRHEVRVKPVSTGCAVFSSNVQLASGVRCSGAEGLDLNRLEFCQPSIMERKRGMGVVNVSRE